MARQYKNGSCSCWMRINKAFEREGERAKLSESYTFAGHRYLNIQTEPLDGEKKSMPLIASYCPFCGGKLKEAKQ